MKSSAAVRDIFTARHAAAEDRVVEAVLLPGQRPARDEDDHVHPHKDVGGVDAVEHVGGHRLVRLHALERELGEQGADEEEAAAKPRAPPGAKVESREDENRLPACGQAPRSVFFWFAHAFSSSKPIPVRHGASR
jgi:hypothetical protein